MKIKCNVIKDILPLYIENIASEDTRVLIEEHVDECEDCKKELEEMKFPRNIPIDINTNGIKKIKNKLFREKFKAIIFSIVLTSIFLILTINYLTQPIYIPYSKDVVSVRESDNGTIFIDFKDNVSGYDISKYSSDNGSGYIYHITTWETIWNNKIGNKSLGTLALNSNGEKVNSIYYYSDNSDGYSSADGPGDILIYGKSITDNGGVVTLPRLVLSYYLLIAIVLTAVCLVVLLITFKWKKSQNVIMKILFIPVSYIIGHICIKGFNSSSYLASRDFYAILLITVPIYLILIIISNFFKRIKHKNSCINKNCIK